MRLTLRMVDRSCSQFADLRQPPAGAKLIAETLCFNWTLVACRFCNSATYCGEAVLKSSCLLKPKVAGRNVSISQTFWLRHSITEFANVAEQKVSQSGSDAFPITAATLLESGVSSE